VRDIEGVKDAVVDMVRMEIVVTRDEEKVDLIEVIRNLREAGFDAALKR